MRLSYLGVAVTLASLAAPAAAQMTSPNGMVAKGGTDDYGPYIAIPNWLKPVREGFLEKGVSVWAETPDHIFVWAPQAAVAAGVVVSAAEPQGSTSRPPPRVRWSPSWTATATSRMSGRSGKSCCRCRTT